MKCLCTSCQEVKQWEKEANKDKRDIMARYLKEKRRLKR